MPWNPRPKSVYPERDEIADARAAWTKRLIDIDCLCPDIPDQMETCSRTCRYCMEHADDFDDAG